MRTPIAAIVLAGFVATASPAHASGFMTRIKDAIKSVMGKNNKTTPARPSALVAARPTGLASTMRIDVAPARPQIPKTSIGIERSASHQALLQLPEVDYMEEAAYRGKRDAVTLAATPTSGKVHKLLWFHGGGQIPNNLIIRRLSRAFAAQGVAVEIHSLPNDVGAASEFLAAQTEPVFVGGHSAGSGLADTLAASGHPNIKGAILLNGATGDRARVPTLLLKGSVDDGEARSNNPLVKPVQVMGGDHSLRYHAGGDSMSKDDRNRSEGTWQLNLLVAQQVKSFVEGI